MIERIRQWLRLWLFPEYFQLEKSVELLETRHNQLRNKVYSYKGKQR